MMDEDLGRYNNPDIFISEVKSFLSSYGPCQDVVEENEVERWFGKMVSDGLVARREDGIHGWSDCLKVTPFDLDSPPFISLESIVSYVLQNVKGDDPKKADTHLISVSYEELTSGNAGSKRQPVCFIAEPSKLSYKSSEVNRKIDDRAIIHLEILTACHRIMYEDIRRMWIYGLTFEDHLCSVWYFSRSHSVKSAVFDWIKNPKVFIQVLLAFAKATPRELGIDPTVHLGPKNTDGTTSFVYEVPNSGGAEPRFYKTVQAVYNPRPEAIAGRTTRVWKVVEVASATGEQVIDEKEVILKDVWLNEGSKTEAENMDAIFAAVDEFVDNGIEAILAENPTATRELLMSPNLVKRTTNEIIQADGRFRSFDNVSKARLSCNLANKAYRSLFLTKLHAWQGEVCKPIGNHVRHFPSLFNTRQVPVENSTQPKVCEKRRKEQNTRRQSRFIYKEVCTTLQHLNTIGDVVDVLCQTMEAMHILFLAGWVHRDLSSNNIMAYRSSSNERWAVKLADLEFSRLMVDPTRAVSADPRTGTPFFMPAEILNGQYLLYMYKNLPEDEESGDEEADEDEEESEDEDEDLQESTKALDDLEEEQYEEGVSEHVRAVVSEHDVLKDSISQVVKRVKRSTLADRLNTSMGGQGSVDDYLHQFKVFDFDVVVPPDPHWDKIPRPSAAVNHNYQHDLESIWWTLLWIILCRIKPNGADDTLKLPYEVTQYFDHDIWNFHPRLLLFTTSLHKIQGYLDKRIFKHFLEAMERLRDFMHAGYLTREVFGHLEVSESYTSIQVQFARVLRALRDGPGRWRSVRLIKPKPPTEKSKKQDAPDPHASPRPSRNRKRERHSDEFEDKNDGGEKGDKDEAALDHPRKTLKASKRCRRV